MLPINIKPITEKRLKQLQRGASKRDYVVWKDYVKARDNYQCQYPRCPNKYKRNVKLEVHHIRKFSTHKHLKTDKFNGITLCEDCHKGIYGREEMFERLFFEIVKSNESKKNKSNSGHEGTKPSDV